MPAAARSSPPTSRGEPSSAGALAQDSGQANQQGGTERFKSPGVELLQKQLNRGTKLQVLDVGIPTATTLGFLSRTSCRIYVEDLLCSLPGGPWSKSPKPGAPKGKDDESEDGPNLEEWAAGSLRFRGEHKLDLVLMWDMVLYLPPEAMAALVRYLAPTFHPRTLLFMATPTAPVIPGYPGRMGLDENGVLCYRKASNGKLTNPRYPPVTLERMLPGFRFLHSNLLSGGMQDYLFAYG